MDIEIINNKTFFCREFLRLYDIFGTSEEKLFRNFSMREFLFKQYQNQIDFEYREYDYTLLLTDKNVNLLNSISDNKEFITALSEHTGFEIESIEITELDANTSYDNDIITHINYYIELKNEIADKEQAKLVSFEFLKPLYDHLINVTVNESARNKRLFIPQPNQIKHYIGSSLLDMTIPAKYVDMDIIKSLSKNSIITLVSKNIDNEPMYQIEIRLPNNINI